MISNPATNNPLLASYAAARGVRLLPAIAGPGKKAIPASSTE